MSANEDNMGYKTPSHDVVNKPGDEGSCPPMPTETINGKSFPNGDNSSVPMLGEITLPDQGDTRHKSGGGGSNPTEAMPGV